MDLSVDKGQLHIDYIDKSQEVTQFVEPVSFREKFEQSNKITDLLN